MLSCNAGKAPGRVLADSVRKSAVCAAMLVLHLARTLWTPYISLASQEPTSTVLPGREIPKLSSAHRENPHKLAEAIQQFSIKLSQGKSVKSLDEMDCYVKVWHTNIFQNITHLFWHFSDVDCRRKRILN